MNKSRKEKFLFSNSWTGQKETKATRQSSKLSVAVSGVQKKENFMFYMVYIAAVFTSLLPSKRLKTLRFH